MARFALSIPTPADARTRRAMLRIFFEQSRTSLIAAALLMGLQTAYIGDRVPPWLMAFWLAGGALLLAVRWRWRRRYLALDDAAASAQAALWQRRVVIGSAWTGLMWGSAVLMDFNPADPGSQMFCAMLICVTCVASVNVMAPVPQAYWALQFPAVAALALSLTLLGSWTGVYFAALVVVGAALAIGLVHRHARLLFESHGLRFEREGLLAQVQEASLAKSRFLASASHDMRQPLHALGLLGARLADQLGGHLAAATGIAMQNMVQTLDTLVEALMDISRLEAGALHLTRRPFALTEVFDRLSTEFAVVADARALQWRIRPTEDWVESDPVQLERVLRNLLSNALRYTSAGGVLMAAQRRGGMLRIGIWDTGPGIAEADQKRVFDEFVQLNNPGRDRSQGLGLGLSIVQRLARLLDHPLELRSRPGRGSLFSVRVTPAVAGSNSPLPEFLLAAPDSACGTVVAL
ncbi:MAG: sensor histidine kinase, partial [Aquabacterium sp.]